MMENNDRVNFSMASIDTPAAFCEQHMRIKNNLPAKSM